MFPLQKRPVECSRTTRASRIPVPPTPSTLCCMCRLLSPVIQLYCQAAGFSWAPALPASACSCTARILVILPFSLLVLVLSVSVNFSDFYHPLFHVSSGRLFHCTVIGFHLNKIPCPCTYAYVPPIAITHDRVAFLFNEVVRKKFYSLGYCLSLY